MPNKMQLGTIEEVVYGTPVVVDRFYEFLGGESLERQQTVIMSEGLTPGLTYKLGPRRVLVKQWGQGNIQMEVATTLFGRWFKWMLGDNATVTANGTSFTHDYAPGDLAGQMLTIQKGVEQWEAALAQPFTFHGCKCTGWEFSIADEGFLMLSVDVDAEDVDTTTGLAVGVYPVIAGLTFAGACLLIDAVTVSGVSDLTVTGENALNVDRYFLCNSGLKEEPLENGFRTITGSLNAEFRDVADFYDVFEADTEVALVANFVGAVIDGTFTERLQITLDSVFFTGDTPQVSGPEPSVQNVSFEAYENDAGDNLALLYVTNDATS